MFHVSTREQLTAIANRIGDGTHGFDEDDDVCELPDGYGIGDIENEDDVATAAFIGTLGDFRTTEAR